MKENETLMVMEDGERDLRGRTKAFALRIIKMFVALPKRAEAQVLGKQALRSGTSVGANYREAWRARSRAEFVSKIGEPLAKCSVLTKVKEGEDSNRRNTGRILRIRI